MADRQILRIKDLDPNIFKQKIVNGECLITIDQPIKLGGEFSCDSLSACSLGNLGNVDLTGQSDGNLLALFGDWVPFSLFGPTATIAVLSGQDLNDVDITLGYQPHPDCDTPGQSAGYWELFDSNDIIVTSGSNLAGTINLDLNPFINEGDIANASYPEDFTFDITYQVEDACGTSTIVETSFIVNPVLKEVFTFTGADQNATAPAWSNNAEVKAWGGGGSTGGSGGNGGAGGFAQDNVIAQDMTIVVGEGRRFSSNIDGIYSPPMYGFGGRAYTNAINTTASNLAGTGGGLSGAFTGLTPVVQTDQGRALIVAGGGAGGRFLPGSWTRVGQTANGSGGATDMKGTDPPAGGGHTEGSGGGGGYFGGIGRLGSQASSTAGTGYAPTGSLINGSGTNAPNQADPDYIVGVGMGDPPTPGDGLVVITWTL